MTDWLLNALRPAARDLPESGFVELVNTGRSKPGLIPLWVGEGHLPTPDFINEAAIKSLHAGETFYTWQRGIPELRRALATYHKQQFGRTFSHENFYITGSGMQAVQIAFNALAGDGDEVLIPTPAWPNFASAAKIGGARPVEAAMDFSMDEGWTLDLNQLESAITGKTRILFINSPTNPTGWTADKETLSDLLDLARRHNIWIVADEVYNRFYYEGERAPSFFDVMEDGDPILFINTFSKNWAMTGWRVGWICAPTEMGQVFENLIQFSTSGVAVFMQRAAVTALTHGETFVGEQVRTAHASRDLLCDALAAIDRVHFCRPKGAFYLYFAIDGLEDTRNLALQLIDEAGIGLAPGTAFGKGGERFLRLCFARATKDIAEAGDRLTSWLCRNI